MQKSVDNTTITVPSLITGSLSKAHFVQSSDNQDFLALYLSE